MIEVYGHASDRELEEIREVERRAAASQDPATLLELGVLYIEPAHREAESIKLFESVLKVDPSNKRARLWLAYCYIHHLMEIEALRRALTLLEEIAGDPELGAAALMLRAEALEDLDELSGSEKIRLLERSVELSPDWVNNRQRLADAYVAVDRPAQALEQIHYAISNLGAFNSTERSIESRIFEDLITGRSRAYLEEELTRLAQRLGARP